MLVKLERDRLKTRSEIQKQMLQSKDGSVEPPVAAAAAGLTVSINNTATKIQWTAYPAD